MKIREMLEHVDHTQLQAYAVWEDIKKLCEEALTYHTASVCIPPSYVKRVHETYGEKLTICTVVGFPLGYSSTEAKLVETRQALQEGCSEIDMVINIGDVKNGDYDKVKAEIAALNLLFDKRRKNRHVQGRDGRGSGLYQNFHRLWHRGCHYRRCGAVCKIYRAQCENKGRRGHRFLKGSGDVLKSGL